MQYDVKVLGHMHHVVRLHDKRRQHCCGAKDAMPQYWVAEADVLGQTCLYALCCSVDICTMLLGCMIDEVNTVAEPKTQYYDIELLRPTCWVRCVYMHYVIRLHDKRGHHCCGPKDAMP